MSDRKKEFLFAFGQTIPVLLGYLFLGIAFGLMLQDAGYSYIWAFFTSVLVYAGSMQFLLVTLLSGGAGLLTTVIMTLFINGRHIFYGLTFIEKFKTMGKAYPYMVFSLTDETYSVLCSLKIPERRIETKSASNTELMSAEADKGYMDEKRVSFYIAALDHSYWILGSVLGAVIGQLITFDTTGIDFSMTALFVVIVVNQWLENKNHFPALIGFLAAITMLFLLGADKFLLPAMSLAVLVLLLFRAKMSRGEERA